MTPTAVKAPRGVPEETPVEVVAVPAREFRVLLALLLAIFAVLAVGVARLWRVPDELTSMRLKLTEIGERR